MSQFSKAGAPFRANRCAVSLGRDAKTPGGVSLARGVRNRNPLNIRFAQANDWQGKLSEGENNDEGQEFEQFEDAVFGLRAAIRLIRTHHRRGASTIRRLATVWAPPGENPHLDAYIRTVAKHAAIDADTALDLSRDAHLRPVLLGMIRAENGVQPYDDQTIDTALALAAGPRVASTREKGNQSCPSPRDATPPVISGDA